MGLKYNASGRTYDLSGPQYTNVGGSKRLNYIANGKTYQLGLATDSTCSQYSPLVMRINGTNHYIGRSTSGSYTTSNSISSTRLNTYTSGGSSTQSYTYNTTGFIISSQMSYCTYYDYGGSESTIYGSTYTAEKYTGYYVFTSAGEHVSGHIHGWFRVYYTYREYSIGSIGQNRTTTKNVYYTTIITNGVNDITVSTTKSASSSSHNFV